MIHGSGDRLDALPAGTELHGYVIEAVLGHGGFGIVYQARHRELDTLVAIKEYIPAELSVRSNNSVAPRSESCSELFEEGLNRFLKEARQLVRFQSHPCVVSCQDLFRSNGTAYLVMERVDGLPLSELLRLREERGQPLTEAELLSLIVPLLEGLAAVHAEGVLHRDVKPANILIRRSNEQPVLIDFGAAKQVVAKQSRSFAPYTEGYAAIEQVGAGELGPWTDIYGLGAVMWRVVAGGNPPWEDPKWKDQNWSPPNPLKVEARVQAWAFHRSDPLPTAQEIGAGRYSGHLLDAIDQCLRLAEEDRIKNCGELLGLIRKRKDKTASRTPVRKVPTVSNIDRADVVQQPKERPKSNGLLAGVVAMAAVLVVTAIVVWMLNDRGFFGSKGLFGSAPDGGESRPETVSQEGESSFDESDPSPIELESVPAKTLPRGKPTSSEHSPSPTIRNPDPEREVEPSVRVPFEIGMPSMPQVDLAVFGDPFGADGPPSPGTGSGGGGGSGNDGRAGSGVRPGIGSFQPQSPWGGVTSPRLLSKVAPEYSEEARRAKLQGTVMLAVEVWEDGIAHNIRVVRSLGLGLDEKAVEAVRKWRFLPGKKDGKPVRVAAQIQVSFRFVTEEEKTSSDERDPPTIGSVQDAKSVPSGGSGGEVFRIGGGVSSPTPIHKVAAQYSREAREAEYEGTVVLAFEVWEDGRAYNIRVLRGLGMGLNQKAEEALLQWEFSPGQKDGKPVRVATEMEFSFQL
ncbi:MAG: TonB family protein [Bryobacterales bacterium]|nr:TonB family protein [Bryobacterales bacterium]